MRARVRRRARGGQRGAAAGLLAALLALASAACGTAAGATTSITDHDGPLRIGVKTDQPRIGLRASNGTYSGFDIDVAKYIAAKLGYGPGQVEFTPITSDEREDALIHRKVDMVVASYSITPGRQRKVLFGGPYYVAHQDILVRSADTSITRVDDLAGKKVCQVKGSVSWDRVRAGLGVKAVPVPATSYGACKALLSAGKIDAMSTDDLILAGFAATSGGKLRVVNAPFSDEPYGVGLHKGDVAGCEAVNKAITSMYQDATAQIDLSGWFSNSGLEPVTEVPQFQGCR